MQDDLAVATSTPAEDTSVRADLEAALGDWDKKQTFDNDVTSDVVAEKADPAEEIRDPVSDDRPRDERGRFTKREQDSPEPVKGEETEEDVRAKWEEQEETKAPAEADEVQPEEEIAPESETAQGKPPPGWSVKSKSEWDQLPQHIKADVLKREEEVNNGFAKLKDYKGLDQYVQMAQSSGTTLETALRNYVGMEQLLRRDPKQGLVAIAQNVGISQQQLQQLFGGASSAQPHQNGYESGAEGQSQGQDDYDDPYVKQAVDAALRPVTEKLGSLESYFQNLQNADQQRKEAEAQRIVDEFSASDEYRYFSDVEGTIDRLLSSGAIERTGDFRADLATAYEQACYLHPEVREALINDRLRKAEEEKRVKADTAAQEKRKKAEAAQRASVSVRGAPSGPVSTPAGSKGSVRDDLAAAWDAYS